MLSIGIILEIIQRVEGSGLRVGDGVVVSRNNDSIQFPVVSRFSAQSHVAKTQFSWKDNINFEVLSFFQFLGV